MKNGRSKNGQSYPLTASPLVRFPDPAPANFRPKNLRAIIEWLSPLYDGVEKKMLDNLSEQWQISCTD